ncbi:lysylphosphatidylglycerol synthase transmembrane domain-containing protein [Vulcanisaeta thermophila]|uniref:lysylphosphatidylglycerol synthase transmembrane domain-containing protein n=1 Tax=Vulcanisaeta thermophila TaxID=867917 RepID=UPI000853AE91|nr:flippase-like domain-containing protein [Vulcanisaeta thermophila]
MGSRGYTERDTLRDVAFVVVSIATIAVTILILVHAGLAKLVYEIPRYPLYLVLAEVIYIIQLLIVGLRLSIIFNRGMGYRVGIGELFQLAMAQTFASLIVPGFYIGGEAISITYLTQRGLPTTRATEGILMRYTLDTLVVSATTITLLLTLYPGKFVITLIVALVLFIAYLVLLLSIISMRLGQLIERIMRWLTGKFASLRKYIVLTENEVYGMKFAHRDLAALILLTVIQWFLSGLTVTLIFKSLGVNVGFITGLLVSASYVVLTYVSILPGSAGIGELANLYLLSVLGLSTYFVSYDVWFRVVTYIAPLILLLPQFLHFTRRIMNVVRY